VASSIYRFASKVIINVETVSTTRGSGWVSAWNSKVPHLDPSTHPLPRVVLTVLKHSALTCEAKPPSI
jgi:hypothetical protein